MLRYPHLIILTVVFISIVSHAKSQDPPRLEPDDMILAPYTIPIVNVEYKAILFQVAKDASSQWSRFFIRLNGDPVWCSERKDLHDKTVNGLAYLSDFPLEEAERMMTSPEWTKAIFVRHPKPRLLSAYLDKVLKRKKGYKGLCRVYASLLNQQDGRDHDDLDLDYNHCFLKRDDFGFFLYNITTVLSDVHWRSIHSLIDKKWWPHVNFVGKMTTLSEDAKEFLDSIHSNIDNVSAWERIGSTGWGANERNCSAEGTDPFLAERRNRHQTDARDKMMDYYTPELENFVESHWGDDLNNHYFDLEKIKLFGYYDKTIYEGK